MQRDAKMLSSILNITKGHKKLLLKAKKMKLEKKKYFLLYSFIFGAHFSLATALGLSCTW